MSNAFNYPVFRPNISLTPEQDIENYIRRLTKHCHKKPDGTYVRRLTGETYFKGHCLAVVDEIKRIIPKNHPLYTFLVCIGYPHDIIENKSGIDSLDENKQIIVVKGDKVYVNDLVRQSMYGTDISYGISRITHRYWEDETYRQYMRNLCRFQHPEKHLRELDTGVAFVKEVDKNKNINPHESEIAKKLQWAKRRRLEGKLERSANSYVLSYAPSFEEFILIKSVLEHGIDFLPFDKIREMMIETRLNAFILTSHPFEKIIASPENRRVLKIPNYVSILEEIIETQRQKIMEIKRS